MARGRKTIEVYDINKLKLRIPVTVCDNGHKHVPVKGKCLMCEFHKE